jgi:hypothetical protein
MAFCKIVPRDRTIVFRRAGPYLAQLSRCLRVGMQVTARRRPIMTINGIHPVASLPESVGSPFIKGDLAPELRVSGGCSISPGLPFPIGYPSSLSSRTGP